MSDPTATAPPPTVEPEKFPSPGALEFVNQGIIRIHFPTGDGGDRSVRVRRPFLGELKTIRLALEEIRDELALLASEIAQVSEDLRAESEELARQREADEIDNEAHKVALRDIRRRDREAAQKMEDARESLTLEWWQDIFRTLGMDSTPDPSEYPAWILDQRLPQLVLNHWRQIPSGPG